jgi:hypothetical protein
MVKKNDNEVRGSADVIWDEIKDLPIQMFALPNQKVGDYLRRVVNANILLVKPTATAVLPALEAVLGSKYSVVVSESYWTIKREEVVDVSKVELEN